MTNVDHGDRGVSLIRLGRVAALNRDGCLCEQDRASKEVVFMGTAWVRDNRGNHEASGKGLHRSGNEKGLPNGQTF